MQIMEKVAQKNIVIYEAEDKSVFGYRLQVFPEWEQGTKIMCDGVRCKILFVVPFNNDGIKFYKSVLKCSEVHKQNLKLQRDRRIEKSQLESAFVNFIYDSSTICSSFLTKDDILSAVRSWL